MKKDAKENKADIPKSIYKFTFQMAAAFLLMVWAFLVYDVFLSRPFLLKRWFFVYFILSLIPLAFVVCLGYLWKKNRKSCVNLSLMVSACVYCVLWPLKYSCISFLLI